jgi:hypothetical protein
MNYCLDLYECVDLNEEVLNREEQLKLIISAALATHFDKYLTEKQFERIESTTRLPFMQHNKPKIRQKPASKRKFKRINKIR